MGCASAQVLQLWQSSMYLAGALAGMFAIHSMPACVDMARGLLPDACNCLCASATAEALLFPKIHKLQQVRALHISCGLPMIEE